MITYHELVRDLLTTHRESYKDLLHSFRPGDNISKKGLLDAFVAMQAQGTVVFVALHAEDGIVGSQSLLVEQKMIRNGATAGHLEDICVASEYHGAGIGSKLVELCLAKAKSLGCYKVIADTKEELVPRFARFGFDSPERMIRKYLDEM